MSLSPLSRRSLLKTGVGVLGATTFAAGRSHAISKAPGDTIAVAIGGDFWHNPLVFEYFYREVFGYTDWRLFWAQSAMYLTPELIDQTDIMVLFRGTDPDEFGFSPKGLVEQRPLPYPFMTPVQEDAIVEKVNDGMALLALHGSTRFPNRTKYLDLVGVKDSVPHGHIQDVELSHFNQNHPITRGVEHIRVGRDQTIAPEIVEPSATLLFEARGEDDGTWDKSGWCFDRGDGRVVVMLPGHHQSPWTNNDYKKMVWRAGHWALKREIPERDFPGGTPLKPRNYQLNPEQVTEME